MATQNNKCSVQYLEKNVKPEVIERLKELQNDPDIYFRGVHSLQQAETTINFRSLEGTGKYDISGNNMVDDLIEAGELEERSEAYDIEVIDGDYKLTAKGVNAAQDIYELFAPTSRYNGDFTHIVAFTGYLVGENLCKDGYVVEVDTDEAIEIITL